MDDLHYNYYALTNRLSQITDPTPAGNYPNDIDGQSAANYYQYDQTGNLIQEGDNTTGNTISWNVYGKIQQVDKHGTGANTITYSYDASGNRISKTTNTATTYYVRDASGNVMAVYEGITSQMKVIETDLYGSSRVGLTGTQTVATTEQTITGFGTVRTLTFTRGEKSYELSNHLGNVLSTISDRRQQVYTNNSTVSYYMAEVTSATDYYPFGMQMPGRTLSSSSYRYGFNGQEKSSELTEGQYTAQFWEYDSRIGRRWNVDPQFKKYVDESSYLAFHNNPISVNDPAGDDPPKNFKRYSGAGGDLYLPKTATVETISQGRQSSTQNRKTQIATKTGDVRSFNIGDQRFVAGYNPNGSFAGYYNYNTKEYYTNPDIAPLNGTINTRMDAATHFTNTGRNSGAQGIQIVETNAKNLPIQEGLTAEKHTTNGQTLTGFVDGGKYSPFASPGKDQYHAEAVPGTPYFINSGLGTGTITTYPNGSAITMSDGPSLPVRLGIVNFQTIIVATNFYGSGQNVVMGVFDWGFKKGEQTRAIGDRSYTTITQKSLNILKHDYPTYKLNQ